MQYRREIDGLRAIAVIPVIMFHAGFQVFSGGYVGVDVFFVISGFLITSIILKEKEVGKFTIARFYERRARRILPALFLIMFVSTPFAWYWMLNSQFTDFSQSLLAMMLFASNILFWRESGYFAATAEEKPFLHTWSLAVEEQYYVVFPVLIILFWRFGRLHLAYIVAVIAAASFALAEYCSHYYPVASFYIAPTRAWELLAGSLTAFVLHQREYVKSNLLSSIGLALILASIFLFDSTTRWPSIYTVVPVLGTVLIIFCASPGTLANRFLSVPVLVGVGLISYSAYLWHQPLFVFARLGSLTDPNRIQMFLLVVGTLFLAWLTWKFVEVPFRSSKHGSITLRGVVVILSLAGIPLILAGIFGVTGILKTYFGDDLSFEFAWARHVRQWSCLIQDLTAEAHPGSCFVRSINNVLLWGDSHAASLYPGLAAHAGHETAVTQLTQSGCPPLFSLEKLIHRKNCNRVNEIILEHLSKTHYDAVILHAAWIHPHYLLSEADVESKLRYTLSEIKTLTDLKTKIVLVGPVPRWRVSAQHAYTLNRRHYQPEPLEGPLYWTANTLLTLDETLQKLSIEQGITYVSPISLLCRALDNRDEIGQPECLLSGDGSIDQLVSADWGHLSKFGAELLVDKSISLMSAIN